MMKLVAPVLLLAAIVLAGCSVSAEQAVRDTIEAANYCETDADCTVTTGVCPFGCYVLTHRSESGAVAKLMNDYPTNCTYSCIQQPPYSCVAGKCAFQY